MSDLSGELSLPLSGDLGASAHLLVDLRRLRRLTQLLSDTGQHGLLTQEQRGLQFLSKQEVMFGLLHLRDKKIIYYCYLRKAMLNASVSACFHTNTRETVFCFSAKRLLDFLPLKVKTLNSLCF